VGAGCALVGVLVVSAVLVVSGGSGGNADASVLSAVNSALADRTAQMSVHENLTAGGVSASLTGNGVVDFTTNDQSLTGSIQADGQQIAFEVESVDAEGYIHLPALAPVLGNQTWLSVDLSSLTANDLANLGAIGSAGSPARVLTLLAKGGGTVTSDGATTIDGAAVQAYTVTFTAAQLAHLLSERGLPAWAAAAARQALAADATTTIYVAADGRLAGQRTSVTGSVAGTAFSVDATTSYDNYGVPVNVTVPPANQVISLQAALQELKGAGGVFAL
jgi:hypothetical protein